MFRSALITLVLVAVAVPSVAQQQPRRARPREETIAAERNDKVAELWPERTSPLVDRVNRLVERGFREGLDSGKGGNGAQIVVGGMRSGRGSPQVLDIGGPISGPNALAIAPPGEQRCSAPICSTSISISRASRPNEPR